MNQSITSKNIWQVVGIGSIVTAIMAELGMFIHTCKLSISKAETEGSRIKANLGPKKILTQSWL